MPKATDETTVFRIKKSTRELLIDLKYLKRKPMIEILDDLVKVEHKKLKK